MRINRSVIFAVGIAGALSGFKKGDKEADVVRREKYKAQKERPPLVPSYAGVNRTPVKGGSMSVVEDVDEEEEESVVDLAFKTVLDAPEEGLPNESGARQLASPAL
jgi:hypothetical protein